MDEREWLADRFEANRAPEVFAGRAWTAQLAFLGGAVGLVWAPGARPRVAFEFTITHGRVAGIEMVADPDRLRELEVTIINN
jgi:RNA polymerase sigma-70 factor (ECF subfamily)